MFYHSKELQFNARVSRPDPRFARLLLEQFGGGNGELKASMQYFVQAFGCRFAYPDKYDMLMDIATEEFSHLEIVGATITMLLSGVNGAMKEAAESEPIMKMMEGGAVREEFVHQAFYYPQFNVLTAGGPTVTDCNGLPWNGSYVNANGDLTVDLRSDIAAESRAKIVYEYLMKFTDDEYVRETLGFLMTREITHFQQFEAALETIAPNFPPGTLQEDARYGNLHFDLSGGEKRSGPWKEGSTTRTGDEWRVADDPASFVDETDGLLKVKPKGNAKSGKELEKLSVELGRERRAEVDGAVKSENIAWSTYGDNGKHGR